jgi:NADPH2:quinone reductase
VGPGVTTGVKVGDAVMAMVVPKGSHGAYRAQIVLQARAVVPAPADTTHVQACTLPMNGLTARQSLDLLGLSPGQTLAMTGAAGAYGGYVVQLAKADGLTVIADASEADHALVKALGADIVVRRGDDVATRMLEHFPHGVDGLADGAVLNDKVIPAVRDGGAFTSVRGFIGAPQRGLRFTATSVRTYDGAFEKLDRLRQLVESGAVTLRVAATYPPERAGEAHRQLEAGWHVRTARHRVLTPWRRCGPWRGGAATVRRGVHVWGPSRVDGAMPYTGHETTSPVHDWASPAAWRGDG